MKLKLITIAASFFAFSASAQQINTADLDRFLDSLDVHRQSMASVLLTRKGQKLYERVIGYAVIDSTHSVKATSATRYRIGSITKTFTATMIMQLVDEQKLALNTHLDKYFPNIPNAAQITIEMMLRHRSGIYNFTDADEYWKSNTESRTRAQMLSSFEKHKPAFVPDAQSAYCNTNYVLLGYIIEDVTGKSYGENLQERILGRVGITNTSYGGKIDPARGDAYSYSSGKQWEKHFESDLGQIAAAGSIVSTPADVTAFMNALLDGKLVSQESLRIMTSLVDGFGIGLMRIPFFEYPGYGHTGGIDGFVSIAAYFPEDSLTATVFSNGVDYPLNDIVIAMLGSYHKVPIAIPDFKAMKLDPTVLEQYVGEYTSKQIDVKMKITHANSKLYGQPTGQPPFILTPVKKDVFKFDAFGLVLEFRPGAKEITITQAGDSYLFTK